jgi:hypothetical protein
MNDPGLHPDPPPDFFQRRLPLLELGGTFFRSHRSHNLPLHYGRYKRYRFDDPEGQYGVLYAASDAYGAFIETFGQVTGVRTVSTATLKSYCLSELYPERPLILADLFSSGCLARIGADSGLFAGERSVGQIWSRAIYDHPYCRCDGILYPARHNHQRQAVAVFDRAPQLVVHRTRLWYGPDSQLRAELGAILDFYDFGIVETDLVPEKKDPGTAGSAQGDLFQ